MTHRLITEQDEFEDLCRHIREAGRAAFDTEFVSEDTYRPELCLLQFATHEQCAAADPLRLSDLGSWWDIMCDDRTEIIVHGGQAEIRFCLTASGRPPRKLADVQLAEGLRSRSYPLAYSALLSRVLGIRVHSKETRTEWRRRPLSEKQIEYALDDVRHILEIWQRQRASLKSLGRLEWAEAEFGRLIAEAQAELARSGWERLPGVHKLSGRELAVARELCAWRTQVADARNQPVRRMLRDDLIIELARRHPLTEKELLATRDMQRSNYRRAVPELLKCIERGLAVPEAELPVVPDGDTADRRGDEHVVGQLLGLALANRCAEINVARPLVATSADLRHLVRWHVFGEKEGPPPRLTEGWRAQVCGELLEAVLDGKIAIRVADPESDHPLIFEGRMEERKKGRREE
jgi:ribonuclease D